MFDRLPKYIDPFHLADKRSVVKGVLPLNGMSRLAEFLRDDSGQVAIDLFFGRVGRLAVIEGNIETTLQLICQNCLQAVDFPIDSLIKLGIVGSLDEADRLPENVEPLLLEEENLLLTDIVEDELLLIIPQYPKHAFDCLQPIANRLSEISATDSNRSHRDNPFSILTHFNLSETPHGSTKK